MTRQSKLEYIKAVQRRYGHAGREHQGRLLDEVCAVCGWSRKWAIRQLRRPPVARRRGGARRRYGAELVKPLQAVWLAAEQPCGKRLVAMLPEWLAHLRLSARRRQLLLSASARTLDRLLSPLRVAQPKRWRGTSKPGGLLRQEIPLRTSNADIRQAGYLEVDTVAHCGGHVGGDHVWTLTLTDIHSGWTCLRAVWNRGETGVHAAVREVERTLPFKLLGFDSDNGGEFINQHLHRYLGDKQTRGRPYRKNDNAHVEQKNWTHARRLLGYERLACAASVPNINALFGVWEELQNHFCTTMKLVRKERTGAKVTRRHDAAQTPYARLLADEHVNAKAKAALRRRHAALNPWRLAREVERRLRLVWQTERRAGGGPAVLRTTCPPPAAVLR